MRPLSRGRAPAQRQGACADFAARDARKGAHQPRTGQEVTGSPIRRRRRRASQHLVEPRCRQLADVEVVGRHHPVFPTMASSQTSLKPCYSVERIVWLPIIRRRTIAPAAGNYLVILRRGPRHLDAPKAPSLWSGRRHSNPRPQPWQGEAYSSIGLIQICQNREIRNISTFVIWRHVTRLDQTCFAVVATAI